MADPWKVLGLSADAVDEKQVRSAYARLLKIHRPDQDPEGFQRLRAAYQYALEWLQQRDAFEQDDWGDEGEAEVPPEYMPPAKAEKAQPPPALPPSWGEGAAPSLPDQIDPQPHEPPATAEKEKAPQTCEPQLPLLPSWGEGAAPGLPDQLDPKPSVPPPLPKRPARKKRPARDWPREWSYSLESLDRALKEEPREFDAVSMALKALTLDVMEYGIPPQALECILADAFQDEARLFGMHAPEGMVLYLLKGGCLDFLSESLLALKRSGSPIHITRLAQKLDECSVDVLSPATVAIFFEVAGMAAIHNPFIAKSIARKLRRLLADDAYVAKFDLLHVAIMRGMSFRDLTPEHREFWSGCLERPKVAFEWRADELSGQALDAVVSLGRKWVGLPLVQELVPPEVWERAWKGRRWRVLGHQLSRKRFQNNSPGVMLAVLACVLFSCSLRLFNNITDTQRPAPISIPQSEEFQRNYQRGLELLQKHRKEKLEKDRQNAK